MKPYICFYYLVSNFTLKNRNKLKLFILDIFKTEHVRLERIDYIFCSDKYLFTLNSTYLKHNTYTDIIAFPLSEFSTPIISDIYISIDRVKENAFNLHTTFTQELHRVIFHGALHLCGYMDKTKDQKKIIREKEDFYLSKYFVSRETL